MKTKNFIKYLLQNAMCANLQAVADDKKSPKAHCLFGSGAAGTGPAGSYTTRINNFIERIRLPFKTSTVSPEHDFDILYGRESPVSDYADTPIGSFYFQFTIASTAIAGVVIWKKISSTQWVELNSGGLITDPGDAAAIPVTMSGLCSIVTAGSETRTMAIPSFPSQEITLCLKTDGGDAVITVASAIDALGHTTVTLNDARDHITLNAIYNGTALAWSIKSMDGVVLGGGAMKGALIADPGDTGAIPVIHPDAFCALTSAGAETRTLADSTMIGQQLRLWCDTYVGDIVLTTASACNAANNNTLTFGVVSDFVSLVSISVGGALVWQIEANDGVALSTV